MDMEDRLLKELRLENLQELHREIANVVGVDGMIKLSDYFGGTTIYIPKQRELVKNLVIEKIQEGYTGTNIRELAQKYDVSESFVYNALRGRLLKGAEKKEAKENVPGQYKFAGINMNIV